MVKEKSIYFCQKSGCPNKAKYALSDNKSNKLTTICQDHWPEVEKAIVDMDMDKCLSIINIEELEKEE